MRDWVHSRIEGGRYASISDSVRDLIRRDQAMSDAQEALVAALIEGERSGVGVRRVPDILAALRGETRCVDE